MCTELVKKNTNHLRGTEEMKATIKRANDNTYCNEKYTMFRMIPGVWVLYKDGVQVDQDMFRWDLAERNNLAMMDY